MLQASIAALVLLIVAFVPPPHGRTLLVPFDGEAVSRDLLKRLTLFQLKSGPLPGSIIVEGKGRELAPALFNEGVLMLAAPAALCGGDEPQGGA